MAKTPPIDARFVSQDITAEIDGEQGVVQERLPFHGAGEGAILPHSLGKPATLRTLLQVAETFSEWADSRFHAHCPSLFLAAGSVTPEGMRSLLRWVSKRICLLAPPIHSSGARHPKQARVIAEGAYWAICRTLNGFLLLDEMILGQDENEEAWNQNEGVRRVSKGVWERPMTVGFRHWFLERAAPGLHAKLEEKQQRLFAIQPRRSGRRKAGLRRSTTFPSRDSEKSAVKENTAGFAKDSALRAGLDEAVQQLDDLLRHDLFKGERHKKAQAHGRFVSSFARFKKMTQRHGHGKETNVLIRNAQTLQVHSEEWIRTCLPLRKRGHVDNQNQKRRLRRHVAFVCQYATLVHGNERLEDMLSAVVMFQTLCSTLVKQLKKALKRKRITNKPARQKMLLEFDRKVVATGMVDGWRQTLGEEATAIGALCRVLVKRRISSPWGRGDHVELVFPTVRGVRQRIGDGKPVKARTARRLEEAFVDDLLVPMQAVGLAAEAPWDFLWERASSPNARLKSHKGKKWVINPFGLLLAGDDVS